MIWDNTSVDSWARSYVLSSGAQTKIHPPETPQCFAAEEKSEPLHPGRDGFEVIAHANKIPGPVALKDSKKRAELLHTFLHHEVQAAELMCVALLRFHNTPLTFRQGLIRIVLDEVRHMQMYEARLHELGFHYGSFPVRDWFWQRLGNVASPLAFVSTMQVGIEGANLDHTARFAELFRKAGDEESARIQEVVGQEEIAHVRFGVHWFEKFAAAPLSFDAWKEELVAPLSPWLMRHVPIERKKRALAGLTSEWMDALEAYEPH